MHVRLAPMLKLSPMFSSLPAGRTLRAWLTHGTALLVLAGCAAVPGEPPQNQLNAANADKSAAPALKVPDVRDNPDAWGALSFRSVPELVAHIQSFIADYNDDAHPFVWTKSVVHQKRLRPCFAV